MVRQLLATVIALALTAVVGLILAIGIADHPPELLIGGISDEALAGGNCCSSDRLTQHGEQP